MKTLRTNFPYRLNVRSKDLMLGSPIGAHFYLIERRSGERNNRCRKNGESQNSKFL